MPDLWPRGAERGSEAPGGVDGVVDSVRPDQAPVDLPAARAVRGPLIPEPDAGVARVMDDHVDEAVAPAVEVAPPLR